MSESSEAEKTRTLHLPKHALYCPCASLAHHVDSKHNLQQEQGCAFNLGSR